MTAIATIETIPGYGTAAPPRRPGLPSLRSLTYAKELMTVALLALAFAWLLPRLVTRPGQTIDAVGKRVTGGRV